MNKWEINVLTAVLLIDLLLASNALAMSSTNYHLNWFTPLTGGGGGPAESASTATWRAGHGIRVRRAGDDLQMHSADAGWTIPPGAPDGAEVVHDAVDKIEGAASAITVLNVDADSNAPLAGWTMRLYAGSGCTGSAIQTGVTDADGLVSFTGLVTDSYSVHEALRSGYINVSPLCQDVTLAQLQNNSKPDNSSDIYPPGGDDTYAGGAYLTLQIGTQPADTVTLNGPLIIRRDDPGDSNRNGLADVQMQVVNMTLSGDSSIYGPISLRYQATPQAVGRRDARIPSSPQALPWTGRADYMIVDNGVVAEGGSVFSFGGHNDVGCVTDMRHWDPDGGPGVWNDLTPLPEVLDGSRGVFVDDKIYVPGGWECAGDPKDVLYIYDIAANTWSPGAPPPSGRAAYGIAAVDGAIYRIGGCADAACTPSADVDVYDIDSDTWSSGASYPIAIAWQVCGTIEGQIYCAGGYDGVAPTHKAYRYTPLPVDAWDDPAMTDLCHQWWAMGAGDNAIDSGGLESLYIYGGVVDGFDVVTDMAVHYDKSANSWYYFEPLNVPAYRQGGGSADTPLGNQYSVGGLLTDNPPGVGFTLDTPAGGYYFQHYPTIPPAYSLCAGPPPVILPDGLLEELQPAIPFPASGRFDLSFYLDVGGLSESSSDLVVLHNRSPLQTWGTVAAIPMNHEVFAYGSAAGPRDLPLYDSSGLLAGYVQYLDLATMAPGNTLVAFANRQTGSAQHFVHLPLIVKSGQSVGTW